MPAVVTVLNANDSGSGSLRDTIATAQQADTLLFDPSLAGQTIDLGSGALVIDKDLIIQGPEGPTPLTLRGSNLTTVVDISAGSQGVLLAGLRVAESGRAQRDGAAIRVRSGFATLRGVQLDSNGGGANYHGVELLNGVLSVDGCTIQGTTGTGAAGLAVLGGAATVTGSTIKTNPLGIQQAGADGKLTVQGSEISNNSAGGLDISAGTLILEDTTIAGNQASAGAAGLSVSGPTTQVTLLRCTLNSNVGAQAGGIAVAGGTLSLLNSTLFQNSASGSGVSAAAGALFVSSSPLVAVVNCTITDNASFASGAGGIAFTAGVRLQLFNSVLFNLNTQSEPIKDVNGTFADGDCTSNLIGDRNGNNAVTVGGDTILTAVDPLLGPLEDNGGPTLTQLPQTGSPLLDAGNNSLAEAALLTTDQRGLNRLVGTVDLGAVEVETTPSPTPLTVTSTADAGTASLRDAIVFAQGGDTITIDPSLAGQSINLSSTLRIDKDLTIQGSLGAPVTIQGVNLATIIDISSGGSQGVLLANLRVLGAGLDQDDEAAIRVRGGQATLQQVQVDGNGTRGIGLAVSGGTVSVRTSAIQNNAIGISQNGGFLDLLAGSAILGSTQRGIRVSAGSLFVQDCTIAGNRADSGGAGMDVTGGVVSILRSTLSSNIGQTAGGIAVSGGTVSLLSSTFLTNTATGVGVAQAGGAVFVTGGSSVGVVNCTITDNIAESGGAGGITFDASQVRLFNSILFNFAGTPGKDVSGTFPSGACANDLIGDPNGNNAEAIGGSTIRTRTDPRLGPAKNNGGLTLTREPLASTVDNPSPVIDAGDNAFAANLETDQRGFSRFLGSGNPPRVDLGAVEVLPAEARQTTLALRIATPEVVRGFAPGLPVPEEATFFDRQVVTLTAFVGSGLLGTIPQGIVNFYLSNGAFLGTAPVGLGSLTSGVAPVGEATLVLPAQTLTPGRYDFRAVYTSDVNDPTSGPFNAASFATQMVRVLGNSSPGMFDPRTATWYLGSLLENEGASFSFQFGFPGFRPVVGDWDGDVITTVGVVDPTTQEWMLREFNGPGAPDITFSLGTAGSTPVTGDWDRDGKTDVGYVDVRGEQAVWHLARLVDDLPFEFETVVFGSSSWIPLGGDYNSDGRADLGMYDPAAGAFRYAVRAGNGGFLGFDAIPFGTGLNFAPPIDVGSAPVTDANGRIIGFTEEVRSGGKFATSVPVVGDWLAKNEALIGVVDPESSPDGTPLTSHGRWKLANNNVSGFQTLVPFTFGEAYWIPLAGIWGKLAPLRVPEAPPENQSVTLLTDDLLQAAQQEALQRLSDIDPKVLDYLRTVRAVVRDLPDPLLAVAYFPTSEIIVSTRAGGFGWFSDASLDSDANFQAAQGANQQARPGTPGANRPDLLTALLNQMARLIGRTDLATDPSDDLLKDVLPAGVRRVQNLKEVFTPPGTR